MSDHKMKRGYDVPMTGAPQREIVDAPRPAVVSLRPTELRLVKPKIDVKEGETVAAGQPLFHDRERPAIRFPSPGGGEVVEIRFGRRRVCQEIFVKLAADEPFVEHGARTAEEARALDRASVVELLLESGMWTLLRRRPYSLIPDPASAPDAIFVGASDNDPLPFDHDLALAGREADLQLGIELLAKLADGKVHVCSMKGAGASLSALTGCERHSFSGPYPAGRIEAQIHYVLPHRKGREVWYLDAQDAAGIGELVRTGRYPVERVVAVGGEGSAARRHFRARRGVSGGHLDPDASPAANRFVSGGPLTGVTVSSESGLGHYDSKFSVIPEGDDPEFVGWMLPGFDKVTRFRAYASAWVKPKAPRVTTKLGGGVRAHVATGIYEDVCAVDILPAYLMKAIAVEDIEETEKLGIADCAECGLCTFVCPSKIEFGEIIRRGIVQMVKEGA